MQPRFKPSVVLKLLLLPLLMSGCALSPQRLQPPLIIQPAEIPELPQEARQPPVPALCSEGCSKGLTMRRESWLRSQTTPTKPALPASAPTPP